MFRYRGRFRNTNRYPGSGRKKVMNRSGAISLLRTHVKRGNLLNHCLATGAIMHASADRLGEDPDKWELIGILHDIDFEEINEDMAAHGIRGEEIILRAGIEPGIAAVVARHNYTVYGDGEAPVDRVLQAADNISGLIISCALVKGGAITEVTSDTIRKKFREKSFAAGCLRERVRMIEPLLSLPDFFETALRAVQGIRGEIGLR